MERLEESNLPAWAWHPLKGRGNMLVAEGDRTVSVATDDPALLRVVEPFSPVRWMVRVTDVSKNSMCVLTQTALLEGSLVQVHVKNTSLLAVVQQVAPLDDPQHRGYFHAGLEIQHVF
jgi:hypothetical protein